MRTLSSGAIIAPLVWLLWLATATVVYAQAPSGAEAIEDTIDIPSKTLDNGLEVIVIEDHALPLVTIELVARNGAYTEPPAFNGLSHLYEHMFFKGNAAIPSQESYMARQRELGMIWNGTTSDERVNYYFTLGSSQLDAGMEFMSNAIQTPLFKEEELVKERTVVIGELDRAESNPYYHLNKALTEKMFWKYPTRKDTIGDRKTITTASREKMLTVQKKFYVPNNSALILAGDVTPDQAFELARKHFGAWKKGADPFKLDPVPKHPPIKKTEAIIVNQQVQRVTVMLGFHGPSVGKDPAATYAADVFSFILAQPSSAFQKALVES
ncbi:MAG: pitrilysin family protein, partial [Myxococcota bacterium]